MIGGCMSKKNGSGPTFQTTAKDTAKLLEALSSRGHSLNDIFRDWVEVANHTLDMITHHIAAILERGE